MKIYLTTYRSDSLCFLCSEIENGFEEWLIRKPILNSVQEIVKVADSVLVFPYACAIQYRRVRGRTLLPGSEWDRV